MNQSPFGGLNHQVTILTSFKQHLNDSLSSNLPERDEKRQDKRRYVQIVSLALSAVRLIIELLRWFMI